VIYYGDDQIRINSRSLSDPKPDDEIDIDDAIPMVDLLEHKSIVSALDGIHWLQKIPGISSIRFFSPGTIIDSLDQYGFVKEKVMVEFSSWRPAPGQVKEQTDVRPKALSLSPIDHNDPGLVHITVQYGAPGTCRTKTLTVSSKLVTEILSSPALYCTKMTSESLDSAIHHCIKSLHNINICGSLNVTQDVLLSTQFYIRHLIRYKRSSFQRVDLLDFQ